MEAIQLTTLADYRERYALRALCPRCDRVTWLDLDALQDRFGEDVVIDDIAQRLRCIECRQRPCLIMKCWHGGTWRT